LIRERTDSGEFELRPPQVSVVIPTFNNSQLLPRAIQSVLEQTFSDIEVLIIDDGSTDNTPEVVASFLADPRVRYIRHDINLGPSATRNTGIREARGDLVAFLDSDDWWDKEKLYLQLQALIDERYSACAARAYIVDSDGIREQPVRSSADSETLYRNLLYGNVIPGSNSSVIVRTSCFDAIGMFDEELLSAEDQDLWLRLAAHYRFIFLVDVRPLVYIDKRRTNDWMDN
jgi:glycosyltransferase involved in cell wall biosynthesis